MEFTFTLTYRLAPTDNNAEDLVERLAEVGCDDALVGIGHPGRIALEFVREAPTARDAMESALRDAQRAMPTATLIEVSPDLVGITDVAEITGVTRQNIRKLLISRAATAPAPVHAGNPSLWHLTDMLSWLGDEMNYRYPSAILEVARGSLTTETQARMKFLEREYSSLLRRVYSEGVEDGSLNDLDPGVVVNTVMGACNSIHRWYHPNGELTPKKFSEGILQLLGSGFNTRK